MWEVIVKGLFLTRNYTAPCYWVASPSSWTNTYGIVVDYFALSISTASSSARILAFEVETGLWRSAFGARDAFRSTFWWYSQIAWLTSAYWGVADWSTCTMRATWRWIARLFDNIWRCWRNYTMHRKNGWLKVLTQFLQSETKLLLITGIGRQDP